MTRLSIVIPWTGDEQAAEDTLVSVLQNRPEDSEILVVHRGVYEDPYALGDEVRFISAAEEATLLELINDGVDESDGDYVHLLQAGVTVEEGWADAACAHFDDARVGMVTPLILCNENRQRIVSAGVRYGGGGVRREYAAGLAAAGKPWRGASLGPSLLAGFYRNQALIESHGFAEELGELADVDLALTLRTAGYRCEFAEHSRLHAGAVASPPGGFQLGRQSERLFWRHAPQIGMVQALLLHVVVVASDLAKRVFRGGVLGQLCGRLVGLLESPRQKSYHRWVRNLRKFDDSPLDRASGSGLVGRAA